jgi:hypothetical protein
MHRAEETRTEVRTAKRRYTTQVFIWDLKELIKFHISTPIWIQGD